MGTRRERNPRRRDGSGENPAVHRHGNQAGAVGGGGAVHGRGPVEHAGKLVPGISKVLTQR